MKQGPKEQFETPLGEALSNLPQEEPPAGLQAACLTALDNASTEVLKPATSRGFWEPWRQLAAAAAILVMIFGAGNLVLRDEFCAQHRARPPVLYSPAPAASGAPAGPSTFVPPPAASAPAPASMPSPSAAPRADKLKDEGRSEATGAGSQYTFNSTASPQSGTGDVRPWRDTSDQRQKITQRSLELETPQVEDTYKQAVGIIEKSGGFVVDENLSIQRHRPAVAHVNARIPVEQFEGVLSQVRELGKVVLLSGQSQDRTEEYQTRGAQVRDLGGREEELVRQYERERNSAKKAQIAQQLAALRSGLRTQKSELSHLSNQTHFANLNLTITEGKGFRYLLRTAAQEALPLAFSLSLIAVPLLVLALIWKRRR